MTDKKTCIDASSGTCVPIVTESEALSLPVDTVRTIYDQADCDGDCCNDPIGTVHDLTFMEGIELVETLSPQIEYLFTVSESVAAVDSFPAEGWFDSFTDADATALTAHTPDSPIPFSWVSGTGIAINGNQVTATGSTGRFGRSDIEPDSTKIVTASLYFSIDDTPPSDMQVQIYLHKNSSTVGYDDGIYVGVTHDFFGSTVVDLGIQNVPVDSATISRITGDHKLTIVRDGLDVEGYLDDVLIVSTTLADDLTDGVIQFLLEGISANTITTFEASES